MAGPVHDRERRQKIFLRALLAGQPVARAAEAAGIKWATLYVWRREKPPFRAAWDAAAKLGIEAMAARFDAALVERAVDGVDEPVFRNGEQVGTRKRYSDALLMFGINDMRERQRPQRRPASPAADQPPRITVVVRQLGQPVPPVQPAMDAKEGGMVKERDDE